MQITPIRSEFLAVRQDNCPLLHQFEEDFKIQVDRDTVSVKFWEAESAKSVAMGVGMPMVTARDSQAVTVPTIAAARWERSYPGATLHGSVSSPSFVPACVDFGRIPLRAAVHQRVTVTQATTSRRTCALGFELEDLPCCELRFRPAPLAVGMSRTAIITASGEVAGEWFGFLLITLDRQPAVRLPVYVRVDRAQRWASTATPRPSSTATFASRSRSAGSMRSASTQPYIDDDDEEEAVLA